MTNLRFVARLRDLVDRTDLVLSDIWGVLHDGLKAFPEACAALQSYRARGGAVMLITNSARPAGALRPALRAVGVTDDSYDAIVSSGDLARTYIVDHPKRKMFWLG